MISEGKVDILNNSRRLDNLCEGPKRDLIRGVYEMRVYGNWYPFFDSSL